MTLDLRWEGDDKNQYLFAGDNPRELAWLEKRKVQWSGVCWLPGIDVGKEYNTLAAHQKNLAAKVEHWFQLAAPAVAPVAVSDYPIPFALVEKVENRIAYRIALGSTPRAIAEDILSSIIPATKGGEAALLEEWTSAYAAFKGEFDTPLSRRRSINEYAEDARKRLREFDERIRPALSAQDTDGVAAAPGKKCPYCGDGLGSYNCFCTGRSPA